MNDVVIFENEEFGEIRTVEIDNEPWFVGKDVAKILGYSNSRKAIIDHIDEEDKGVMNCDTLGGTQEMAIINESGLYSLIFSSKLPTAKKFKHWVTSEVLPAIRKTGQYGSQKIAATAAFALESNNKYTERKKWVSFMLQMLHDELGLSVDNMLHQCYKSMSGNGFDLDRIKSEYIAKSGISGDCSTLDAVLNDKLASLEITDILSDNMSISFIKRCL